MNLDLNKTELNLLQIALERVIKDVTDLETYTKLLDKVKEAVIEQV